MKSPTDLTIANELFEKLPDRDPQQHELETIQHILVGSSRFLTGRVYGQPLSVMFHNVKWVEWLFLNTHYLYDMNNDLTMYENNWQWAANRLFDSAQPFQSIPVELYDDTTEAIDLPDMRQFPVTISLRTPSNTKERPFAGHPILRRDCFTYFYLPLGCPRGQNCCTSFCPLAHSRIEMLFHPLVYRTRFCRRAEKCNHPHCAFLHNDNDDRQGSNLWLLWEKRWAGWRRKVEAMEWMIASTTAYEEEVDQLVMQFRSLIQLRKERSTPEEVVALEHINNNGDGWVKPFELRLHCQPLNFMNWLIGPPVIAILLWYCLYTKTNMPDGDEFTASVIEKLWKLIAFWSDTVDEMVNSCLPPSQRTSMRVQPRLLKNQSSSNKRKKQSPRRNRRRRYMTLDEELGAREELKQRGSIAETIASALNRSSIASTASTASSVNCSYQARVKQRVAQLKKELSKGWRGKKMSRTDIAVAA